MVTSKPQQNQFIKTPNQVLGGSDRRVALRVWKSIAESMARVNLLKALIKEGMGLAELEEFNLGVSSKFKSSKFKSKPPSDPKVRKLVTGRAMKLKLADEQCLLRELCQERTHLRRNLAKKLIKNSRPYRKLMSELRQEEAKSKNEATDKFKNKIAHLKNKYSQERQEFKNIEEEKAPFDLQEYSEVLTVFDKNSYDKLEVASYKVKTIGDIRLSPEEEKVLTLHPKFCVLDRLQEVEFEHEQECSLAKMRMEIQKEQENSDLTSEEIQENQEYEAAARQVYDSTDKKFDARKRRVTDLPECSRINLPKPLNPEQEAAIELRKTTQMQIFKKYVSKNTSKNGDQNTNLTQEEQFGLKSLQKRIASGELIVIKTDKSSKLAVTNQEEYKKMGQDHTMKDNLISRQEVIEMEENLNGHSKAWANIWNSGRDHNHFERIVNSKVTRSENVADLYLMFKDHKSGNKTRPTATGCSSNTLGLSNAVAELLESVSISEPNRYNCISSEDMLARLHKSNTHIITRKVSIVRKLQCKSCKIMETVDCFDTELHDWDTIRNPAASQGVHEPWDKENLQDRPSLSKPAASQGVPEPWEQKTPQDRTTFPKPMASQGVHEPWDLAVMLARNPCCGEQIIEELRTNCNECGPGILEFEQPELCLIGNDVKALFPSIKSKNTGRIIREAVEKTTMEFEGFDQQKALAYIVMNRELTSDLEELEHLLPTRKSGRTTKLKLSAIDKNWNPQEKFEFKNIEITNQENKKIIARVVEIAVRALFENHAYRFGNEYFHQKEGGSIGDRWTGAAAEVVMQDWANNYQKILDDSGVSTLLLAGYVDDGRQFSTCLPLGNRYDKDTRKFQFSEEALQEDTRHKNNGESTNQRMGRICLVAMNSINSDLEFTIETPEDFPEEKLPTLDFKIWQEPDKTINHCYYQKEVKTPFVIMARSGMATQQKLQILSNELTRRLSNVNQENSELKQYTRIINQFTQELKSSEYSFRTAREIVISGIRGLRTRKRLRELKNQKFYREAHTTARHRAAKKLVSKEIWYKKQEKVLTDQTLGPEIPRSLPRNGTRRTKSGNQEKNKNKEHESKIKSVMFVPFTPGSELAKLLRENEEKLVELTGCKVKIVERTGTKIQELLTRSNPWKGHDCGRQNCLLCFTKLRTEKNTTQDCHQKNIVYQIRCLNCQETELEKIENMDLSEHEKRELKNKIKLSIYIGESSRSTYERGWEHLNDLTKLSSKSHMLKHILAEHPGQDIKKIKFGMCIIRTCKTSFDRQIYESVAIQQAREKHNILNSRAEYNRCSLPRLSTQLGEKQNKEYNKELELEKKADDELEKKIRQLRKERNKERLVPVRDGNVGTKRRKINSGDYVTVTENWGPPGLSLPEKNMREPDDKTREQPPKKLRTNSTTTSITLTNIRTIENKIMTARETNRELEWEEPRDWDKVLTEHRERIEREEHERRTRLEKQRKKKESWALYTLCKNFLEENSTFWKRLKEKQIEENKRLERLEKARNKTREARNKVENNKWEEKLREGLSKVTRKDVEDEEKLNNKNEKIELRKAKENLWKLRNKENKLEETQEVKNIRELDKRTELVITLLEKEKKRLIARDKNLRTAIKNNENKTKKQQLIAEVWTTYRWITEYLEKTTTEWEDKKKQRELGENNKLETWDKLTRNEKIENWIEIEKQCREQEGETNKELMRTIVNEILYRVETTVVKLNKSDGETTDSDKKVNLEKTTHLLQPAKLKAAQSVVKDKKQPGIKNFMTSTKPTTPSTNRNTTSTMNKTTKKTTTTNKNKQQSKITKDKEKNKGYWTQLAARKKQQDQEKKKENNTDYNTKNDVKGDPENRAKTIVNSEHEVRPPDLSFEASPKPVISQDDVIGEFLEVSIAKPGNTGSNEIK